MIARRRLIALSAGLSGLVTPFPVVAQSAECSSSNTVGDFIVVAGPLVSTIHPRWWSNDLYFRIRGGSSPDFAVIFRGSTTPISDVDFRVRFDFDGGAVRHEAFGSGFDLQASERSGIGFGNEDDEILIGLAQRHRTVTISFANLRTNQTSTSAEISLNGLSSGLELAAQERSRLRGIEECAPPPSGACFLTTACTETLGLADDCVELRTLRAFRDRSLARSANGRALVAHYYEVAPVILARLPAVHRDRILRTVYGRFVLPSVLAARLGLGGLARRIYMAGTLTLLRLYAPDELTARQPQLVALFGERAGRAL